MGGEIKLVSLIFCLFLIVISFSDFTSSYPGAYSNTSPVICAENCSGGYELLGHDVDYCEDDPVACFNTIDECADGSVNDNPSPYEWVENITVTSLNSNNFSGGDVIEITAVFDCDYDVDEISFAYNNGTGWVSIHDTSCNVDQKVTKKYNYTLHELNGVHSVRAIIAYNGDNEMICGYDVDNQYSDTDDVSFYVHSDYETNPPEVIYLLPSYDTTYEFIMPKTIMIEAKVIDDLAVDTVIANVSWSDYYELIALSDIGADIYQGKFTSANLTGEYDVFLIVNDTNNNINDYESTLFYVTKTSNITVAQPINEVWQPDYTITLDYYINVISEVYASWYKINDAPLILDNSYVRHYNNDSNSPISYENNSNLANVSQSFNLTDDMNVTSIHLSLKRANSNYQNITIQILNDTGSVLISGNYTLNISDINFTWAKFSFNVPLNLDQNALYWAYIFQDTSNGNYTLFEINNGTYDKGNLSSNNTFDLLFSLNDEHHYRSNITLSEKINNLTVYSNVSGASNLIYSPTLDVYVDRFGPVFKDLSYDPSTQNDIDPDRLINVSVNITDIYDVSAAILQYKYYNDTSWNEVSMTNSSDIYSAVFIPVSEGNWTYRIFANDTLSNINYSNNYTVEVLAERTYYVNTTLFNDIKGIFLDSNGTLGKIGIKNTGDINLTFNISKSLTSVPEIYFNDQKSSYMFNVSINETVLVNITATALGIVSQSIINFILVPDQYTVPKNSTINATLVSFVSGPYFLVSITEYDSSVVQGDQRIKLAGEVVNVGNETADNLTLSWSLPSGFSSKENTTKNLSTLSVGEKYEYRITTNVLANANLGVYDIILSAINNMTNNSDSKSVTIASSAPAQTISSGGSTKTVKQTVTSYVDVGSPSLELEAADLIAVKRGEAVEFRVNITNPEKRNLTNLTFFLDGFLLNNIYLSNNSADVILPGSTISVDVRIMVPLYVNEGEYDLVFRAEFLYGTKIITLSKAFRLLVSDINSSEYIGCIIDAEDKLALLITEGYNADEINILIEQSKNYLLSSDYMKSLSECDKSKELIKIAIDSNRQLNLLITKSVQFGVNTKAFNDALKLARDAFGRGDYILAQSRIEELDLLLQIESKTYNAWFKRTMKQVYENIYMVLGVFVFAILLSYYSYSKFSLKYLDNKLIYLRNEEQIILSLIKKNQFHRFNEKLMSKRVYDKNMDVYRARLAKIQDEKNSYRLMILKRKGYDDNKSILMQIELINGFKSEIQTEFFINKIIDKKSYDKMNLGYDNILSELNQQLKMKGTGNEKI